MPVARRPLTRVAMLIGLGCGCSESEPTSPTLRIFAAASVADALGEAAAVCTSDSPATAVVVAGASSALARQIEQGAPADLFVSANPLWMDHLVDQGRIGEATVRDLLGNHLVVVGAEGPERSLLPEQATDWTRALRGGRLAMGDPDHVPAGLYGKAALSRLGVWHAVEPHLARASDTRAALLLVERGEAPLGLVYATDAAASEQVTVLATIPNDVHNPIVYPLAIVSGRGETPGVRPLWDCLQGASATAVFHQHGFQRS